MARIKLFKVTAIYLWMLCIDLSQEQTGCRDVNALCGTWSGRGVCQSQRDFMQGQCPKTCGFCPNENSLPSLSFFPSEVTTPRTTTSVAPVIVSNLVPFGSGGDRNPNGLGDCRDQFTACPSWASRGQCQSNPDFMRPNCMLSCSACQADGCEDKSSQCSAWARFGQCSSNSNFMRENCKHSCQVCSIPTITSSPILTSRQTIRAPNFQCGEFLGPIRSGRRKRQFNLGNVFQGITSAVGNVAGNVASIPSRLPSILPSRPRPPQPPNGLPAPASPIIPGKVGGPSNKPIVAPISPGGPFVPPRPRPTPPRPRPTLPRPQPAPRPTRPRPRPSPIRPAPIRRPIAPVVQPVSPGRPGNLEALQRPVLTGNSGAITLEDTNCGSTPITDRYLITAAHCVHNKENLPNPRIRLGEVNFSEAGEPNSQPVDYEIEAIILHPGYRRRSNVRYNDIALLRTRRQMRFSGFVFPFCLLPRKRNFSGVDLTVAGFGLFNGTSRSPQLLQTTLEGLSDRECEQRFQALGQDLALRDAYPQLLQNRGVMCAYKPGTSACRGDSGGPLFWKSPSGKNFLVGVVSAGPNCGDGPVSAIPGVYTEVAHFLDWIDSVIYGSQ